MTKIKYSIVKYNCKGINYPSEKGDWKKFEKNNLTIALNVFCANNEKIYPGQVSRNNAKLENNKNSEGRTRTLYCSKKL